ncbi:5103_t:CDS:1 [Diversispora eburnea]|uniref:5103_t:CDS:1 n=1 Tax=Diversispora eburnea TaxID=1213867 RepID=A0A9N8ZGM5_9GLOM|nr:5103_t:CDS:1 [Diversispora eburnea]
MLNENDEFKKWFKILFNAFHREETAIEFLHDSSPPQEFFDIFSPIKHCITNTKVIYYWSKDDETKIIQQAIDYIEKNFQTQESIESVHRRELQAFKDDENRLNFQQRMEWTLQNAILEDINNFIPGFNYLYKYGWMPSLNRQSDGKNDLILTNGKGIFAIVETKRVDKHNKDLKKYRKYHVIAQAIRYKRAFIEQNLNNPDIIAVVAVGITEEHSQKRYWPGLYDERVFRAFSFIKYGRCDFSDPEDEGFFYASSNSSNSSLSLAGN